MAVSDLSTSVFPGEFSNNNSHHKYHNGVSSSFYLWSENVARENGVAGILEIF